MEHPLDITREGEVACLLASIDENYRSVLTALTELKSSRKLDLFIRKRLDAVVAAHIQLAARMGTHKATRLVCRHLGEKGEHSIIVTNTWLSILLVDYRLRYDKIMHLAQTIPPGPAHCEIVEMMHELLYITATLQSSIGIKRASQRIQAVLAVAIEGERKS